MASGAAAVVWAAAAAACLVFAGCAPIEGDELEGDEVAAGEDDGTSESTESVTVRRGGNGAILLLAQGFTLRPVGCGTNASSDGAGLSVTAAASIDAQRYVTFDLAATGGTPSIAWALFNGVRVTLTRAERIRLGTGATQVRFRAQVSDRITPGSRFLVSVTTPGHASSVCAEGAVR